MLDRLAPLAHFLRVLVESALDGFENMLMLPARDPSLLAGGAAVLDSAALAGASPIAAQDQPIFFIRVAVSESLTSRNLTEPDGRDASLGGSVTPVTAGGVEPCLEDRGSDLPRPVPEKGLAAGGRRIRTRGPSTKGKAMGSHSRQALPFRT
jgi:hypothetical protein